jgi:hypothetical protein
MVGSGWPIARAALGRAPRAPAEPAEARQGGARGASAGSAGPCSDGSSLGRAEGWPPRRSADSAQPALRRGSPQLSASRSPSPRWPCSCRPCSRGVSDPVKESMPEGELRMVQITGGRSPAEPSEAPGRSGLEPIVGFAGHLPGRALAGRGRDRPGHAVVPSPDGRLVRYPRVVRNIRKIDPDRAADRVLRILRIVFCFSVMGPWSRSDPWGLAGKGEEVSGIAQATRSDPSVRRPRASPHSPPAGTKRPAASPAKPTERDRDRLRRFRRLQLPSDRGSPRGLASNLGPPIA